MDAAVLTAYGWADLLPQCRCEFLLDYEDEDPEIRRRYADELACNGVPFDMPKEIYEIGAHKKAADPRFQELLAGGRD